MNILKATKGKVVVTPIKEETAYGGIIVQQQDPLVQSMKGEVRSVGSDVDFLNVGDIVVYGVRAGLTSQVQGVDYTFLNAMEVLGVIEG